MGNASTAPSEVLQGPRLWPNLVRQGPRRATAFIALLLHLANPAYLKEDETIFTRNNVDRKATSVTNTKAKMARTTLYSVGLTLKRGQAGLSTTAYGTQQRDN